MARALTLLGILVASIGGFFQVLKPLIAVGGFRRVLQDLGNGNCTHLPSLQACEEVVLHSPTGFLYLACSTPFSRSHWTPAIDLLNETGRSEDYVATYDPKTLEVTKLKVEDYHSGRGLSLHGMDVVQSSSDPSELFLYLINHRVPLDQDPKLVGADSSVEIFKTHIGSSVMTHVKTVEDPSVIITPNDIVGSSDGKSFYFTNSLGSKTGLMRYLVLFGQKAASVGFCHADEGCKIATSGLHASNGIAWAHNGTIYVSDSIYGGISVLERQADNTLVLNDFIPTDRPLDNLSLDDQGVLWAAGFPKMIPMLTHIQNPYPPVPASALSISANTGDSSFYGKKYQVETVFEDDGSVASASTTVVRDTKRGLLYLHGVAAPALTICKI